jgi:hypothetical protein
MKIPGLLYRVWWGTRIPAALRARTPYFSQALQVISRHDPEGLLDIGAPSDEYAPEAEDFARLLTAGATLTPEVVADVWEHWFGPDSGLVTDGGPAAVSALADDLDDLRRRAG